MSLFSRTNKDQHHSGLMLVSVFSLTIFVSAALLFSVQPMFAKLVLPLLGGSPSVWNSAMVFFQGTLLCGYIYAHLLSKHLPLAAQVIIHILLLCVGLLFMPLAIASGWSPPESGVQAFWVIGLFAVSLGMPFFAISANAPLLQRWFSRTSHRDADDPYFLYAASNLGSLLFLALYPIFFEPALRLQEQTNLWAKGYGLLIAGITLTGFLMLRHIKPAPAAIHAGHDKPQPVPAQQKLLWVLLAFIPSSLMLGITAHITINIASTPFLWIIPLALYLITFIIVFARKPIVHSKFLLRMFPWVVIVALIAGFLLKFTIVVSVGLSLVCYFLIALTCHAKLAEKRPDTSQLTQFYIWMSLGGVLGGVFNALIAPLIFPNVFEYLLVLLLALFCMQQFKNKKPLPTKHITVVLVSMGVAYIAYLTLSILNANLSIKIIVLGLIVIFGTVSIRADRRRSVVDLIVVVIVAALLPLWYTSPILTDRSFFGVIKVTKLESDFGPVHRFVHGDTIHNYQFREAERRKIPLTYYSRDNSFDRALSAMRAHKTNLSVGMIGLGAGAMACYEKPGDDWTYFEIDPAVVEMAKNARYFSYLQDCSVDADIRVGDARLTFSQLAENSLDIIMVDAFSSDSIPAHLITKEALNLYVSRLKNDGVIFFHTSNRTMDISSVVSRLAQDAGLDWRNIFVRDFEGNTYQMYETPSKAVVVGKVSDLEQVFDADASWTKVQPSPYVQVWSDDYHPILGTIRSTLAERKQSVANR